MPYKEVRFYHARKKKKKRKEKKRKTEEPTLQHVLNMKRKRHYRGLGKGENKEDEKYTAKRHPMTERQKLTRREGEKN